jgi:hypothetical protein
MNDVGHYTAVAENIVGKDQTNCNAYVNQMPNIDRTPMVNPDAFRYLEQPSDKNKRQEVENVMPPKVIVPLSNVKLEEGQSVLLACKIEGLPRPKVLTQYFNTIPSYIIFMF